MTEERAKKIKILLLDVDGVLTDGRIIYDSKGRDMKFFDVHDGLGVYLLKKCGIKTMLITAKGSKAIIPRARDMQVEEVFIADKVSKTRILDEVLNKYQGTVEEICFVGDDLVDLSIMKRVGLAVAVANACPEIKEIAHHVTQKHGGRGAVREVAELILKAQGKWSQALNSYR